ncbi:uncharacterized protein [Triticum aestivum]|nr:uncharacterized protein LOC123112934 isoform X3 [Triticum aestivum]
MRCLLALHGRNLIIKRKNRSPFAWQLSAVLHFLYQDQGGVRMTGSHGAATQGQALHVRFNQDQGLVFGPLLQHVPLNMTCRTLNGCTRKGKRQQGGRGYFSKE